MSTMTGSVVIPRARPFTGVPSYWLLDPTEPGQLTVFELADDGRYGHAATVEGEAQFHAVRPFPVSVIPARLLDGLRPR